MLNEIGLRSPTRPVPFIEKLGVLMTRKFSFSFGLLVLAMNFIWKFSSD